jgi:hypothetical protein
VIVGGIDFDLDWSGPHHSPEHMQLGTRKEHIGNARLWSGFSSEFRVNFSVSVSGSHVEAASPNVAYRLNNFVSRTRKRRDGLHDGALFIQPYFSVLWAKVNLFNQIS